MGLRRRNSDPARSHDSTSCVMVPFLFLKLSSYLPWMKMNINEPVHDEVFIFRLVNANVCPKYGCLGDGKIHVHYRETSARQMCLSSTVTAIMNEYTYLPIAWSCFLFFFLNARVTIHFIHLLPPYTEWIQKSLSERNRCSGLSL